MANTGVVYVRMVNGEETTFGVSGALWRDALVMYDRRTGSYWSQIDGRAIQGPLAGNQLQEVPAVVTTWGQWKADHPGTLVLRPDGISREGSRYDSYFRGSELGIFGTESPDPRLPGKAVVLGIRHGDHVTAVPLGRVQEAEVIEETLGEQPIVVAPVGDDDGRVYLRTLDDQVLEFEALERGTLHDRNTGSTWDVASGLATAGPLAGRKLQAIPVRRAYWFVWVAFHPDTDLFDE